jgi:hypothetical protein
MMDWVPYVFGAFKVLVLLTGMFFAIKSHYDDGKRKKEEKRRLEEESRKDLDSPQTQ